MTEILFNTLDVAKMLQVDKSTVKRWTDEGKLKCFRTPGGHRKFRAEDLYQFMSEYNYGISPINLYPQFATDEAIIRRIIAKKEFNVLANVCFSGAIHGRRDEIVKLFTEVYKNGMSLPVLFDEILRPTMKRIRGLNVSAKLTSAEMQLAFNALSNAIILLSDAVVKATANGKRAICATTEGDMQDIELKALAVLLESEGYDVLNLGVNATTATISQLVSTKQPQFVFLLSSSVGNKPSFIQQHEAIFATTQAAGARLIIGGNAFASNNISQEFGFHYDRHCGSFRDFAAVQHNGFAPQPAINAERTN